ncbi:MAG: tRNA lysidine(34) synthetase TilS [Ruminococcaceae bacterium]|nr:tRNA lysidine(34) synthetase TilS [Oscillospiraceae bacterium]
MAKQLLTDLTAYQPPAALAGLPSDTAVLLAFSGGMDSGVLLALLAEQAKQDGFSLTLAHVNHGIRGADAIRDRAFCCEMAKAYGLEICVLDADVPAIAAARGTGIEETAREVRYAFFERVMRERKIPILATAHHADDQLETVLFRLCRGSGLRGLCGIAPCRRFGDGYLVRPLLAVAKAEIDAFCKARSLAYVTDATNADPTYARNRIRAEVIPVLSSLFDAPQKRVAELTDTLRADEAFLSEAAERIYAETVDAEQLPCAALVNQPCAIQTRVLRLWAQKSADIQLERIHLDSLSAMLAPDCEDTVETALPRDHIAVRWFGNLRILSRLPAVLPSEPIPLTFGRTVLGDCEITVEKQPDERKVHNLYTQTCIISSSVFDIIKNSAYWRSYREGDRILQGGMHKKLRKLWNTASVPPRLRAALPILCDAEGIVWAPYAGMRDGISAQGGAVEIVVKMFSK